MYRSILLVLSLSSISQAQWLNTYQPPGAVEHTCGQIDVLRDVISHCNAQGLREVSNIRDKVTLCHEATHMVNSRIRNSCGKDSFYLGGGYVAILPSPKVKLSQVARYVNPSLRNSTYRLYFFQMRRYWENEPLYVLDEWSSYINGSQTARELGVNNHGEFDRAIWFSHYADCLLQAVRDLDPNYPGMKDLIEVINFQKSRVAFFAGG